MKVHEYQAKAILKQFGVPVSQGIMIEKAEQAEEAYQKLGQPVVAVKAQIHAGGRGKAGGVKIAKNLEDCKAYAKEILGKTLVTPQTGPEGKLVRRLYIEAGTEIQKEIYLAILLDRESSKLMFVGSAEGGTEIEELAATHPEKIHQVQVEPMTGFRSFQGRELAKKLGLDFSLYNSFSKLCQDLVVAFISLDASMIEINPLIVTKKGELVALDAKMTFDDNGLFRHRDLEGLRDMYEEDALEMEASKFGLNYISLDGEIGCMVNGAGLAMATMDVIKLAGANPANFLDVGGSATEEAVTEAFKIILKDTKVRAILVNIFGGIMKCDIIARGIISAAKSVQLKIPVVVRLQGTHAKEGLEILESSGLKILTAQDIAEAARKVVDAARAQAA